MHRKQVYKHFHLFYNPQSQTKKKYFRRFLYISQCNQILLCTLIMFVKVLYTIMTIMTNMKACSVTIIRGAIMVRDMGHCSQSKPFPLANLPGPPVHFCTKVYSSQEQYPTFPLPKIFASLTFLLPHPNFEFLVALLTVWKHVSTPKTVFKMVPIFALFQGTPVAA